MAKGGYNVRVIAEACAGRMVVEGIGRRGFPVRFTVKRENLAPLQPSLFDQLDTHRVDPQQAPSTDS